MEKTIKKKCWTMFGAFILVNAIAAGYSTLLALPESWGLATNIFLGSLVLFCGLGLTLCKVFEMLFMKEV